VKRRTVFILGAGASRPFNFPSGPELRDVIIKDLAGRGGIGIRETLLRLGFSQSEIEEFAEVFRVSQIPSIDAFLQKYPELETLGKTAISYVILYWENTNKTHIFDSPDWYLKLLLAIKDDQNLYAEDLTIISFNYDRSLEYYLQRALGKVLKLPPAEVNERVDRLGIIHFYGSLGELPTEPNAPGDYGLNEDAMITKGAESIHLIGRNTIAREIRERSVVRCSEAETIIILGFGFHPENIQILRPDLWGGITDDFKLYSTDLGMSNTDKERAKSRLGRQPYWTQTNCLRFFDSVDPFA